MKKPTKPQPTKPAPDRRETFDLQTRPAPAADEVVPTYFTVRIYPEPGYRVLTNSPRSGRGRGR